MKTNAQHTAPFGEAATPMTSPASPPVTVEPQGTHAGKMETRLREWSVRLDELAARVDHAGAQAEYRQGVADLKAKWRVAKTRIEELKAAKHEKWQAFKDGIDTAWKDLDATFQKLKQ